MSPLPAPGTGSCDPAESTRELGAGSAAAAGTMGGKNKQRTKGNLRVSAARVGACRVGCVCGCGGQQVQPMPSLRVPSRSLSHSPRRAELRCPPAARGAAGGWGSELGVQLGVTLLIKASLLPGLAVVTVSVRQTLCSAPPQPC